MPTTADAARRDRLQQAATGLGLAPTDGQIQQLMAYLGLLQRWNKVYNLTALRDPDEMLSHHLVDCLAVLPALQALAARRADGAVAGVETPVEQGAAGAPAVGAVPLRILDVGSGGGLPGVVLAVMQPDWQVACVDTVAKKATFVRQVAAELRLPNLQGLHARVESLAPEAGRYDVITSRAFASLPDFTALTRHLLTTQGVWMAMKGKPPADEQAALPADVQVFHVEHLQVPGLDAQRCLVWMRPCRP